MVISLNQNLQNKKVLKKTHIKFRVKRTISCQCTIDRQQLFSFHILLIVKVRVNVNPDPWLIDDARRHKNVKREKSQTADCSPHPKFQQNKHFLKIRAMENSW